MALILVGFLLLFSIDCVVICYKVIGNEYRCYDLPILFIFLLKRTEQ
jgi:hypothetical protein